MPIYIYILHITPSDGAKHHHFFQIQPNNIAKKEPQSVNLCIKTKLLGTQLFPQRVHPCCNLQLVLSHSHDIPTYTIFSMPRDRVMMIKSNRFQLSWQSMLAKPPIIFPTNKFRELSIDFPVRCEKHASLTISCHTTMILVASHVDCSCNSFNLKFQSNRGMYILCKQHEKQRKNKTQIATVLGALGRISTSTSGSWTNKLPRYSLSGPRKKPPNPKAFNFKQTSCTEKT